MNDPLFEIRAEEAPLWSPGELLVSWGFDFLYLHRHQYSEFATVKKSGWINALAVDENLRRFGRALPLVSCEGELVPIMVPGAGSGKHEVLSVYWDYTKDRTYCCIVRSVAFNRAFHIDIRDLRLSPQHAIHRALASTLVVPS